VGGNLLLAVRPLLDSGPHDVVWRAADSAREVQILKNPAYAGAYGCCGARTHYAGNMAVAALGEIEAESRTMERQWTLKRERARYDAERAR
jgi:hypothetical protein